MMKKTTFALIAGLAAMTAASPVFAQSYNPADGTGNELPFAYGVGGVKQRSVAVPPAGLIAQGQSSGQHLYAFAPLPARRIHR
jgi:hypothetical protein